MQVTLIFKAVSTETIDLVDYGYSEDTSFDDLTEEQQNEITDPLREAIIPDLISIKNWTK